MPKILNLTRKRATQEQKNQGLVDLNEKDYINLCNLLEFKEPPDMDEVMRRAALIGTIGASKLADYDYALIEESPYMTPRLEYFLIEAEIIPVYSFNIESYTYNYLPDGTIQTIINSKFVKFFSVYVDEIK